MSAPIDKFLWPNSPVWVPYNRYSWLNKPQQKLTLGPDEGTWWPNIVPSHCFSLVQLDKYLSCSIERIFLKVSCPSDSLVEVRVVCLPGPAYPPTRWSLFVGCHRPEAFWEGLWLSRHHPTSPKVLSSWSLQAQKSVLGQLVCQEFQGRSKWLCVTLVHLMTNRDY